MGNAVASFTASGNKNQINFEDIQAIIGSSNGSNNTGMIMISTLPTEFQKCVIRGTIPAENEEVLMNNIISGKDVRGENITVVVYGKNAADETVTEKYEQLIKLGMPRVCIIREECLNGFFCKTYTGANCSPLPGMNWIFYGIGHRGLWEYKKFDLNLHINYSSFYVI